MDYDLIITILPVVTEDLPISPRFTPCDFLSRCKFSNLATRQPMVELYHNITITITVSRLPLPPSINCPLQTNTVVGVGKERRASIVLLVHGDLQNGSTRYWNYLGYWPCAGGLSAVNAIGTQLRDPINSALTQWRVAVKINKWTPPRKSGGIP